MIDLFDTQTFNRPPPQMQGWKPRPLDRDEWPPNYNGVYVWRMKRLALLRANPDILKSAIEYYKKNRAEFIMHWMDTYNPRLEGNKWVPFVMFKRQYEFCQFYYELRRDQQNGLVEKCRDMGATWLMCGLTLTDFLFNRNDAIGWGSRKESMIDKIGDADSIFEKMRLMLRRLPDIFHPPGFKPRDHATFMKLINPSNGSTITGEAGDSIGRGGRKGIYAKDEAQPLDSLLLTPEGWVRMGDIKVGQKVIGSDGKPTKVTHINDCGEAETYRLRLGDGTEVDCSENHLWATNKGVVSTSEMLKDFIYRSPGGQTQYRRTIPLVKPVVFAERKNLPLDPYVLGVLLGDGSIGGGVIKFTSIDQEIVNNVESRLPEGCKIVKAERYAYRIVDVRGRQGNKKENRSRAREAVKDAGIYGLLSQNKHVPDEYKFSSVEQRLNVLQGLMDTDGSASGGTTRFHTCSAKLAKDVRFIVQSLGGVASMNIKKDHRGFRDMFTLHVSIPDEFQLFKLSRKNDIAVKRKKPFTRSVRNITPLGKQVVRCITVDNADGLYLTNECILTHNSAHYERAEKIQSALDDNTNVQIDISSVNGVGNVFHRKRESGIDWKPGLIIPPGFTRVFVFDWRDNPMKTQEWYDKRKEAAVREGMQHIFAQEVERNYSAAVQNTIIDYEWIEAAVDAHIHIPCLNIDAPDVWMAALDVADGGLDRNALSLRQWVILRHIEEWGGLDTAATTTRALKVLRARKIRTLQYDSIGVGAGVRGEYNRLLREELITPYEFNFVPWNAGAALIDPYYRVIPDDDQSLLNRDYFANFKAQAWWSVRTRFYKTWRARVHGDVYLPDELISLDSASLGHMLAPLKKELTQPVRGTSSGLKMIVEKTPSGTRSPNLADSVVQVFFPAPNETGGTLVGNMN